MRARDAVGRFGEQVAAASLIESGLTIVDRNWRCCDGEIDIVAIDRGVLAIIEVKTRSSTAFGDPAQAVTRAKAARLRRLAARWLTDRRQSISAEYWPEVRFDVVCVLVNPRGRPSVRHLKGAFG